MRERTSGCMFFVCAVVKHEEVVRLTSTRPSSSLLTNEEMKTNRGLVQLVGSIFIRPARLCPYKRMYVYVCICVGFIRDPNDEIRTCSYTCQARVAM